MKEILIKWIAISLFLVGMLVGVSAQAFDRTFSVAKNTIIEIQNPAGLVTVNESKVDGEVAVKAVSSGSAAANLNVKENRTGITLGVSPGAGRVDIEVTAPADSILRITTVDGQITVSGSFAEVEATTDTGTIYADTEFSNLKYKLLWTLSYPRYLSEDELEPIKEKSAGKHVIEGFAESEKKAQTLERTAGEVDAEAPEPSRSLYLRTARGIILFNVPPSQVPNDLLPKKMTVAARAILQGGDTVLANAIRRSAPALFSEYADFTPSRPEPVLGEPARREVVESDLKRVSVQVTDLNNRAFGGLTKADFIITERGVEREIVRMEQSTAPFNLLLLLDVSGSVENHVDFIRKAARSFVNTVDVNDRVSIVTFNDDVQKLSAFTADKNRLSESLDSFDAGGGTALYDAIAYGLIDTIKPLKGDRTAIVILSDGDDNRSFLPFEALIGTIQESGALVYPMFVPSSLIATSGNYNGVESVDPLRDRYLTNNLSSKAGEEGERLASVSGGMYFPISRLSELQKAYNDIVVQLRAAYTITFRSEESVVTGDRASPKLKVAVRKKDAFVKIGPVTEAEPN